MKKLLIGLLIVALAVIAALGFSDGRLLAEIPASPETPESAESPAAQPAEEPGQVQTPGETEPEAQPAETPEPTATDYAAIYALHDPEEVVMTVDGRDVTWRDYFYAYYSQAANMEDQFQMYQYYGYALGWESQADEEGHSYAELLAQVAEENLRRVLTAESVAEEQQIRLLPEEEEAIQTEHQSNIQNFCGEDGTEEQFFEQMKDRYLTPEFYWRVMRFGPLTQATRRTLFGENGEALEEQQVLDWMAEQGILSADHILISTQELDENAKAEKEKLARELAEELQAIEDVQEREKRFLELKEQYGEDPGSGEGYVFGPGVMVQEFYDGTLALEEGAVSDPVESQFGYHIILRRPLHADDEILAGSSAQSARLQMTDEQFSRMMQERMDAQQIEYAPGFQAPDILDYIHKPLAEK